MSAQNAGIGRNYQLDNVRAILIFLVVLGHLLQPKGVGAQGKLINFIYTFHMAVFVFTTGYYARFDRKKIIKHYLWPYLFFQTAYYYYYVYVLKVETEFQLTTPHFSLWYLLTAATYLCLIPMLRVENRRQAIIAIMASFAAALLVGMDETIGLYLSLSRTIAFLPFFLMGLYRDILIDDKTAKKLKANWMLIMAVVMIAGLELLIWKSDIQLSTFMLSKEYSNISALPIRLAAEVLGLLWIYVLFRLVPNRNVRIITAIGQNTMPVYLLHGFTAKAVSHYHLIRFGAGINELVCVVASVVIVLIFGNAHIGKIMKDVF